MQFVLHCTSCQTCYRVNFVARYLMKDIITCHQSTVGSMHVDFAFRLMQPSYSVPQPDRLASVTAVLRIGIVVHHSILSQHCTNFTFIDHSHVSPAACISIQDTEAAP